MTSGLDRRVRRGAVAVIVACVSVLVVTGLVAVTRLRTAVPTEAPAYAAGERVDVPGEWYAGYDRTVIIFASRDCGACQRAQPAFAWAHAQARAASAGAVFATPIAPQEGQLAFGTQAGFTPGEIRPTDMAMLRVRLVPTFMVIDRDGTILFAREGELGEEDRRALVRALDLPAPAS